MVEIPNSHQFIGHAAWACTERNKLAAELLGFEAGAERIGPHGAIGPMNAATKAHIAYLRGSIDTLDLVIAACIEAHS